ncbi:MDR family MFS transporter [Brevibacterium casei]|uniref:Multidrug efflux MFS transporter n=1 Tax=Brevibacterium casei TaxID=33889 RepID=A0A7T4A181_9MICO|nr:MDR family MFS transporter [Brevibacterium casei]QQB15415.1 multidrug efflux MFS transporter [Brevibacterium casei]
MTKTTDTAEAAARSDAQPTTGGTGVIWLLLGAAFVTLLNETVMGVAIPHLVTDLGVTLNVAQWTTTAFMLTMAVVIPTTGYLLKRLTTRQVFLLAMSLFTAGTLLGALAPEFSVLIVARVIQASGTAMMMPLLMTTIMTVVPEHARGRFMGRITIVMAVAPALGPTLSGFILSTLTWHFLFWIILPVAIAMMIIGALRLRNIGEQSHSPLDWPSLPLSALGFGGLVYGFSTLGSGSPETIPQALAALAVGVLGLDLFIWRQLVLQRGDRALLDLRVFQSRSFSLAVGLVVVMMAAMFGSIILLPIYLQNVLQLDSVTTGMMLLPGGLAMGLAAPFVGRLFDRYGPRPLVIPGALIASAVLWSLTQLNETSPAWFVLLGHMGLSLGVAMMMTPLLTSALGSLSPQLYSHGSATVGAIQQVAGAIGTALFITVLSLGTVAAAGGGATPVVAQADGVSTAFFAGAVLSLVAVVGSWFVKNPAPRPAPASTEAPEAPATTDA